MEALEYITKEGLLQCTMGSAPGIFTPTYNTTVKINGCVAATKVDMAPLTNVPSFVICKKTKKACTPVTTPWQDTYPVKVKGQETLIGKSCITCGIGGKIEFIMSGQIPLDADEKAALKAARDDVQKAHDEEMEEKNKPWWKKAGEFIVDCVPIVGPIVSLVKNVSKGNWGMALLDVGFLALDVVGVAGAVFTGGGSLAATTAAKVGIRQAVKAGAKQVAKKLSKEALEAAAKQTAEMLSKLSVKSLTKGRLCVFACFPAGTPVATKDGLKNIEEIQVGDEVWAYDETNGEVGLKPVINTFNRTTDLLVKIEIDGEIITATPEHPFYANGDWKAAGLLETGDNILLFSGKLATVKEVKYEGAHAPVSVVDANFEETELIEENSIKVFNFKVEEWHTYFVGKSRTLVHNTDKGGICLKEAAKAAKKILKDHYDQLGKKLPCFPAGALINTANGKIAIEEICVGDEVWAYDLISNKKVLKRVSRTYTNFTKRLVNINFTNGSVQSVTCLHRFWVVDKRAWIEADHLRPNMILLNDIGNYIKIRSTNVEVCEILPTYNFEVEDVHNYFVGEANTLVHNGNPSVFSGTATTNAKIYGIVDKSTGKVVYVGKTIQGGDKRFSQHTLEKGLDKTKFKVKTLTKGEMTAYEIAVKEQHYIKKYGTKTAKMVGKYGHVFNKINAITEKKFLKYFDIHKLC